MFRSIYMLALVLISIFSCVTVSVVICPVYAGEPTFSNARETDQVALHGGRNESVKEKRQQEFTAPKGLEYTTTRKGPKPKGASFIRLRPKTENDNAAGSQKVFDVEFMNDEASEQKTKKDSDAGTYLKFEKMEDQEKNNILVRKATEKDYKTEVSMGVKMSPYSEIYLGKGFLVDRKDDFNVDPRDNGWRLKFKFNF
jgi:hypothetical protein